jgi:hypothetical protein
MMTFFAFTITPSMKGDVQTRSRMAPELKADTISVVPLLRSHILVIATERPKAPGGAQNEIEATGPSIRDSSRLLKT